MADDDKQREDAATWSSAADFQELYALSVDVYTPLDEIPRAADPTLDNWRMDILFWPFFMGTFSALGSLTARVLYHRYVAN